MLTVEHLHTEYHSGGRAAIALEDVSFEVAPGHALALVGESGSGKSTTILSAMGLVQPPVGRVTRGRVSVGGRHLDPSDVSEARRIRRTEIGFVPQDPTTALDPLFTIRSQIRESMDGVSRAEADEQMASLLASLGVTRPRERLGAYAHEFSGGMRQRVAMAASLIKNPKVLMADEPTTALDVTTQLAILRLLDELRRSDNLAIVLVTHDLAVARLVCQELAVMYAGSIVERGPMHDVLADPRHPYTRALLDSRPQSATPRARLATIPGQPPSLGADRSGCPFATRCPSALEKCRSERPVEVTIGDRSFSCHNPVGS